MDINFKDFDILLTCLCNFEIDLENEIKELKENKKYKEMKLKKEKLNQLLITKEKLINW